MESALHKRNGNNSSILRKDINAKSCGASSDISTNNSESFSRHINPKLLKLLSPDGSEYISMESLKKMIKTALGARFSDDEISLALHDLGFPEDEPIHYRVFLDLISLPLSSAVAHLDESFSDWLTTEEWQEAMARVGITLSKGEIEEVIEQTKHKILETKKGSSSVNSHEDFSKLSDDKEKSSDIRTRKNEETSSDSDSDNFVDVSEEFIT
ncbi:hypothetical protein O3M35_006039 [Rhynocoris fuscipes]|uniref:Uncharacterized protein n=1 Tax=Rhynocoris fuscipes TaxID=488301 RepID=A0AAW1DJ73_9HEMI